MQGYGSIAEPLAEEENETLPGCLGGVFCVLEEMRDKMEASGTESVERRSKRLCETKSAPAYLSRSAWSVIAAMPW